MTNLHSPAWNIRVNQLSMFLCLFETQEYDALYSLARRAVELQLKAASYLERSATTDLNKVAKAEMVHLMALGAFTCINDVRRYSWSHLVVVPKRPQGHWEFDAPQSMGYAHSDEELSQELERFLNLAETLLPELLQEPSYTTYNGEAYGLDSDFATLGSSGGTAFAPATDLVVQHELFGSRWNRYIFCITDGEPERSFSDVRFAELFDLTGKADKNGATGS